MAAFSPNAFSKSAFSPSAFSFPAGGVSTSEPITVAAIARVLLGESVERAVCISDTSENTIEFINTIGAGVKFND